MLSFNANGLTSREMEVLEKLVYGKTNSDISKELSITMSTVKAHCRSIFDKLHVDSRVNAVVKALSEGIVCI